MHFTETLDLVKALLIAHGFSVFGRIVLLTMLGGALGLVTLLVCHRGLYRKGYLKLRHSQERYYEGGVLALWVLTIPMFAVACGTLAGTWWAGHHLIHAENLGERIGKSAFKAIAAGVAAARLETAADARARLADDLMKGKQKVSIKELSAYTSHHLGELSASKIWSYSPVSSENLHGATVWTIEKTVDVVAYAQLGGGGDAVYKLVGKVTEHDRVTDNDGRVTVEEISDVACKTYGDRGVKGMWAAIILQFLLPLVLMLALLLILPPMLARGVREFVAWRVRRSATCQRSVS